MINTVSYIQYVTVNVTCQAKLRLYVDGLDVHILLTYAFSEENRGDSALFELCRVCQNARIIIRPQYLLGNIAICVNDHFESFLGVLGEGEFLRL